MAANQDWSLEGLNAAYRKGYMQGLTGHDITECPYREQAVLESAWEAGWYDGGEALRAHKKTEKPAGGRRLG